MTERRGRNGGLQHERSAAEYTTRLVSRVRLSEGAAHRASRWSGCAGAGATRKDRVVPREARTAASGSTPSPRRRRRSGALPDRTGATGPWWYATMLCPARSTLNRRCRRVSPTSIDAKDRMVGSPEPVVGFGEDDRQSRCGAECPAIHAGRRSTNNPGTRLQVGEVQQSLERAAFGRKHAKRSSGATDRSPAATIDVNGRRGSDRAGEAAGGGALRIEVGDVLAIGIVRLVGGQV